MKKLLALLILNIMPCINAMLFNPTGNKSTAGAIIHYDEGGNKHVFLRQLENSTNITQYGPVFEWYEEDEDPGLPFKPPLNLDKKRNAILAHLIFKRRTNYCVPPNIFTLYTAQITHPDTINGISDNDEDVVWKKLSDLSPEEIESMPQAFRETLQKVFPNLATTVD